MFYEEILLKALQKAEKNGYKDENLIYPITKNQVLDVLENYQELNIIFSHEFAKSFFGSSRFACKICGHWEEWLGINECGYCKTVLKRESNLYLQDWQFHLQQMILESEPVKYLENYLD